MSEEGAPLLVGVDTGGTFTDIVVWDGRRLRVHKTPSTPADPSRAILKGLSEVGITPGATIIHGSTVATNALLERRGARTAFLATAGFRDILELGRQTRLDLYSLEPRKHRPLVPRELCFDIPERITADGRVLTALDEDAVRLAVEAALASGAEAVAITFLFSFLRPAHERQAARLARRLGLPATASHEIVPEYREYERASTTAANAYVNPIMARYLIRLRRRLASCRPASVRVMQSNGGLLSVGRASREAVRTLLSGPAGGVIGAWRLGEIAGHARLLTFDMGGTSTDVAMIDGVPEVSPEGGLVDALPIRVPMLGIHTIGAGGGSIVWLDNGGGLRVGPSSAGADPGPAAYGGDGPPTVTDANVLLDRLPRGEALSGCRALDREAARRALTTVAARLRLSAEELALGVIRLVNTQMGGALRRVSVDRGADPRDFTLVAFGGGGPVHACELAAEAGVRRVLVPGSPGTLSALGMLLAEPRVERSITVMRACDRRLPQLSRRLSLLEERAGALLASEGTPPAQIRFERWADMRYAGQSYELLVPLPRLDHVELAERFHAAHLRRYGHCDRGARCVVVNLRVRAAGPPPLAASACIAPPDGDPAPASCQSVVVDTGRVTAQVIRRSMLRPGDVLSGPTMITQPDTTTWIPPGWNGSVDGWYNILLVPAAA